MPHRRLQMATRRGVDWWRAGGAPEPTAVYQPIGAASLAASYTNLVNPGTFDAAPGVAPTWASETGWGSDGTRWLDTGIAYQGSWTALVRFSNYSLQNAQLAGVTNFSMNPRRLNTINRYNYNGANYDAAPGYEAGVVGAAGNVGYFNGLAVVAFGAVWSGETATFALLSSSGGVSISTGNIQAVAIYDTTLTASQVAAVSAAMAALAG